MIEYSRMVKTSTLLVCLSVCLSAPYTFAADRNDEVKELSGISIIGNTEAPKSLYIVPWKNSEVGVATSLTSSLLDDSMRPIDKEVFMRELNYYELSVTE